MHLARRYVPVHSTTAFPWYMAPEKVLTPFICPFSTISSDTSAWRMVRCWVFSMVFLIWRLYSCLSAWALKEWTAGPLDSFNILDWIKVLSIFFPISPPNASSSLTRCPLELPPTLGLHGMRAILSTLTVNTMVSRPSLAQANAASQPAWPAPTTTISYDSSKYGIFLIPSCFYAVTVHALHDQQRNLP